MCGIAGFASANGVLAPSVADHLSHRGPDGKATLEREGEGWNLRLDHTRLAIVDLTDAGDQPMFNEAGTIAMVFNGEIYNSAELRRYCEAKGHRFRSDMDGEVILHLYEMEGAEAFDRLNGIFAVCLADLTTGQLVLARDPLGVKPLFYSSDGDDLYFASEIQALRAQGAPTGPADLTALAQFLSFLWIPDPGTPYARYRSLPPGTSLRWSNGNVTLKRFCGPLVPVPSESTGGGHSWLESGRTRLEEAADRQMMADVPVGLMASGGIDSSLLWWATKDRLGHCFTIEWPAGSQEGLAEDARAVHALQRQLKTSVSFIPGVAFSGDVLPASGDLIADPAFDLTRWIARHARDRGYKVLLSGQGGDELFAGYRRHRLAALLGRVRVGSRDSLAGRLARLLPAGRTAPEYVVRFLRALRQPDFFHAYMTLCTYSTAIERATTLGCYEAEVTDEIVWARHREVHESLPHGLSALRQAMTLDLQVYMPGLGLSYVDRAGMEFGVEVRVPWLDLELVRWSLTLPDRFLLRWRQEKWLPRRLAGEVLGEEVAKRPKRGFAAPARSLYELDTAPGQLGFRQGIYFARARRMLETFQSSGA